MLLELHIENVAVIERADIGFTPGFNVLTGETGAGKSIIIDAIDAVLGGRASRALVRTGAERAAITAVFSVTDAVRQWFSANDLTIEDDELILQRKLSAEGKGGCRLNGMPVSGMQMRDLGGLLLDIHGQNDGRALLDEASHLSYLDRFGDTAEEYAAFSLAYAAYQKTGRALKRLAMDDRDKEILVARYQAQITELEQAEIRPGEEESLSARRELLRNAGKISEALHTAYEALYGGDGAALEMLGEVSSGLNQASALSPELAKLEQSVVDAVYALEDVAEELRDYQRALDFSPEEYEILETRLALLRRLQKKYGTDENGLLELLETTRKKLDEISFAEDHVQQLHKELQQKREAAQKAGAALTRARKKAAEILQQRICSELAALSMPTVRFQVEITPVSEKRSFTSTGCDAVTFLMSANPGETPGRISKIASGGELSRIMLAMKNVLAEKEPAETLIFDEIDTGVSGVAAQRVAEKIGQLSQKKQVLCVTHLPQIAAMADTHWKIEKNQRDGRTFTTIEALSREGRREELARLHGGDHVTKTTLDSAEEQIAAAEQYKQLF